MTKLPKIILATVGLLTVGTIATHVLNSKIPEHLKLKAPKEKILFEKDITVKGVKIRKYLYVSDVKVKNEKGEAIEQRTKNTKFFLKEKVGKVEEWEGRFYTGEPFYKDNDKWFQTETATTTPEFFEEQTKASILDKISNLFIGKAIADTTSTFIGSGDGYSASWEVESDFNVAHDLASGNDASGSTVSNYALVQPAGANWIISRLFFPVDTSSLPDDATLNSASLNLFLKSASDNGGAQAYVAVVETFQNSTATVVTGDYEDCGSDNGTGGRAKEANIEKGSDDLDLTGLSTIAYTAFTFNATGLGWINKTGITQIGVRNGQDIEEVEPVAPSGILTWMSEQTGTSNDPFISIVFNKVARKRIISIE